MVNVHGRLRRSLKFSVLCIVLNVAISVLFAAYSLYVDGCSECLTILRIRNSTLDFWSVM